LSNVVRALLDEDRVFVTYATAAVFSGDDPDEAAPSGDAFWAGQTNGLRGAAVSGVLKLTVATHTGWIPFRIELHDGPPAAGEAWEEIVEVSFVPAQENLHLQGLDAGIGTHSRCPPTPTALDTASAASTTPQPARKVWMRI
jgi:hypothetical protein